MMVMDLWDQRDFKIICCHNYNYKKQKINMKSFPLICFSYKTCTFKIRVEQDKVLDLIIKIKDRRFIVWKIFVCNFISFILGPSLEVLKSYKSVFDIALTKTLYQYWYNINHFLFLFLIFHFSVCTEKYSPKLLTKLITTSRYYPAIMQSAFYTGSFTRKIKINPLHARSLVSRSLSLSCGWNFPYRTLIA